MMTEIPLLKGILTAFLGIFGTLLGSFSNVIILRMATGKSVVFPPSACPHCDHRLSPFDLLPVFGWLFLRGKCRYCGAPISPQYPLVEAACGVTLAAAFHSANFSPLLIPQAAWGVFMLITAVLWLRGEVVSPRPFLYPIVLRLPLEWLAGSPAPGTWALPLAIAAVSASMVRLRTPHLNPLIWFGCTSIVLLATRPFLWLFPGLLAIVTVLQMLFPVPPGARLHPRHLILFIWCLAGAMLCAGQGQWGF
ncbi:MAG: hypothetical protein A2286_10080 [Gammaproteobacteria bacterium RIFOXYA12_FULL_61_12]|nr:MAG: hypothetical protein A2286_10080 [Gammaproteobacteria bacterium RIFOXYA12_FULL_61_12]